MLKTRLALIVSGLALLAGVGISQARADVITIDGIAVPTGAVITASVIEENLITGPSQTLQGIGIINSIQGGALTPSYVYGQGGLYLTFGFNFTSSYVLSPSLTSAGYVEFTGGSAGVFLQSSNPNLATGSQSTDYTNATTGTNWLSLTPQSFATNPTVQGAGGPTTTTLEATIPNNESLNNFSNAYGSAFFDATGGDAQGAFHTCGFSLSGASGTCPPGFVDMTFTESFTSGASGDFPVSGTGKVTSNVVPEPMSLSLLGAGLIGLGIARRMKKKAA